MAAVVVKLMEEEEEVEVGEEVVGSIITSRKSSSEAGAEILRNRKKCIFTGIFKQKDIHGMNKLIIAFFQVVVHD